MHFLGRFLRSLWHGLDVLRRALHLILLLVLFGFLVGLLRQRLPTLPEKGALVIRPSGELVEELSGEPLARALNEYQGKEQPQTLLWDVTDAIRAAATDVRIQAIVLQTDDLSSAGQAKLEELAAALKVFRATGKKVIAQGSGFDQRQYYLAAQADEIYLDPFGYVLIDGYERYRTFYKEAIDKLGIDIHLFRAGKFKSAAEPYIRRDMSAEDREESLAYLQALWRGYQSAVTGARGLPAQTLADYADSYARAVKAAGGDMASVARQKGLVTALADAATVEQRVIDLVGEDHDRHSYRSIDLADYLKVVRAEQKLGKQPKAQVAVVVASGEILDGKQPPGTIGGDSTSELLRKAREDQDVKAVVLRVDSPGGSVFASEQIYREVQALKSAGKSVVVSMSDLAASGGYYIAAPADAIFASANTITGSIGVFAGLPTFDRTLAKIGVNVDGVGTTALSGAQRVDRPLSSDMQLVLQATVEHTYGEFLQRVAAGRKKEVAAVDQMAQGRVWAGSDALGLGLVDRIGSYEDAVADAAKRAGLGSDYRVRRVEPELNFAQQMMLEVRSSVAHIETTLGLGAAAQGLGVLPQTLDPVAREIERWQRMRALNNVYAYCFCTID
ncbi:MAG: signal peptide peptidase SppA [Steroidobacteraceae bacterium]